MRVFLDANILFSATFVGPSFALLWDLARAGKYELVTSPTCIAEAHRNLARKRPTAIADMHGALATVTVVADAPERFAEAAELVGADDAHVLAAALEAGAGVLVTGDVKHFGALMARKDLGIRVRTVREFLIEGP